MERVFLRLAPRASFVWFATINFLFLFFFSPIFRFRQQGVSYKKTFVSVNKVSVTKKKTFRLRQQVFSYKKTFRFLNKVSVIKKTFRLRQQGVSYKKLSFPSTRCQLQKKKLFVSVNKFSVIKKTFRFLNKVSVIKNTFRLRQPGVSYKKLFVSSTRCQL